MRRIKKINNKTGAKQQKARQNITEDYINKKKQRKKRIKYSKI